MNKYKETFGIDISKDVFDCYGSEQEHSQFKNTEQGFKKFLEKLEPNTLVVMESTGYYHYRLAQFLHNNGVSVSVVNPLSIKRFIQMKLSKIKTDKSDSRAICEYGLSQEVRLYNGNTERQLECFQLFSLVDSYTKQLTITKNKLKGEDALGMPSSMVYCSLEDMKKYLEKELKTLEDKLLNLVKEDYQEEFTLVKSIKGIGVKTAMFLVLITDGFTKFENSSQLCSFVGITPVIRESGSSVRTRSRISKVGNRRLRNLLFMCSMTACSSNPGCKAIYQRIVNKGKSKKLALIAVSNKLLKQSFGIVKSGVPYDINYRSVLSK